VSAPGLLSKNMKHKSPNWPQLVNENGWREVRLGGFWPLYVKVHHGQRYTVGHVASLLCWELRVSDVRLARGDLSDMLTRASVLMEGAPSPASATLPYDAILKRR